MARAATGTLRNAAPSSAAEEVGIVTHSGRTADLARSARLSEGDDVTHGGLAAGVVTVLSVAGDGRAGSAARAHSEGEDRAAGEEGAEGHLRTTPDATGREQGGPDDAAQIGRAHV